ncbi:class I mannose-6-phosphate isomerase [Cohnella hongkongensis]|uniref:Class I mannose-6-phosphate isomerase n=1 Tax=Cohnella hongkongensis TaxID=178337 RepID=A0ABV9FLJ8_9BACL
MSTSNYNKFPEICIHRNEGQAWQGYERIARELAEAASRSDKKKRILTVECYPSVRETEIAAGLSAHLRPSVVLFAKDAVIDSGLFEEKVGKYLTDDRVFGYMYPHRLEDFYDAGKIERLRRSIEEAADGVVVIIGFGASLVAEPDLLVYADLARWEIQQRYRSKEFGNWMTDNREEDILKKYKRGFFFEWRMADRLKRGLFERIDYYLDTHIQDAPNMITGAALLEGLDQVARRPFRLVPYFDPGVWGGTWMEKVCDLPQSDKNYAWSFDGVPEENSLYLTYGGVRIETPAVNAIFYRPKELLGEYVYARFGAEFPIRFDFLDTMEGGNLSLQVHPMSEYIREHFGMSYTQDESYYFLDAVPDAIVYLGVKDGVDPEEMFEQLERAEKGEISFPSERFVQTYPVKKHDHVLIPSGTVHCSTTGSMVLEISATPYIFTFKLWDWDRVGLDGKPRPVHLRHGKANVQWDRSEEWVRKNLLNRVEKIAEGDGWVEERTGLHEFEFIETRRHWFDSPVQHDTQGKVNMLNLIEGREAIVESPAGAFEPFVVHYAETFIIPASVGPYTIRPYGESEGRRIATIKAFIK